MKRDTSDRQFAVNDVREVTALSGRPAPISGHSVTIGHKNRHRAPRHPVDKELEQLTSQEHRILELIGEGMTNRQIADRLELAEKTVKNYVSEILDKLGTRDRTRAVLKAITLRII